MYFKMGATDEISIYLMLEIKAETKYRFKGQEENPIGPQKEKQSTCSLTARMRKTSAPENQYQFKIQLR